MRTHRNPREVASHGGSCLVILDGKIGLSGLSRTKQTHCVNGVVNAVEN